MLLQVDLLAMPCGPQSARQAGSGGKAPDQLMPGLAQAISAASVGAHSRNEVKVPSRCSRPIVDARQEFTAVRDAAAGDRLARGKGVAWGALGRGGGGPIRGHLLSTLCVPCKHNTTYARSAMGPKVQ